MIRDLISKIKAEFAAAPLRTTIYVATPAIGIIIWTFNYRGLPAMLGVIALALFSLWYTYRQAGKGDDTRLYNLLMGVSLFAIAGAIEGWRTGIDEVLRLCEALSEHEVPGVDAYVETAPSKSVLWITESVLLIAATVHLIRMACLAWGYRLVLPFSVRTNADEHTSQNDE